MASITYLEYHIAHHMLANPDWVFDRKHFVDELEKSYGVSTVKTDVDSCAWSSTRPGRSISLGLTLSMIREITEADMTLRSLYQEFDSILKSDGKV